MKYKIIGKCAFCGKNNAVGEVGKLDENLNHLETVKCCEACFCDTFNLYYDEEKEEFQPKYESIRS